MLKNSGCFINMKFEAPDLSNAYKISYEMFHRIKDPDQYSLSIPRKTREMMGIYALHEFLERLDHDVIKIMVDQDGKNQNVVLKGQNLKLQLLDIDNIKFSDHPNNVMRNYSSQAKLRHFFGHYGVTGREEFFYKMSLASKQKGYIKCGGRVLIVLGVVWDAYDIYYAKDKVREIVGKSGGWAGAAAGAWVGGKALGAAGTGLGTLVGGPLGGAIGGSVGGVVGTLGGGIGGYIYGEKATKNLYDYYTAPRSPQYVDPGRSRFSQRNGKFGPIPGCFSPF
ncbi:MAG: hypothetical protein MPJ24_11305 [Pirellulaceae bacterium]|nr:hypothetical protein [Pirellulaceae bacterium]